MKKMRVHMIEDFTEMSELAAEEIINELKTRPSLNLGLATGNSPVGVYSRLLEAFKQGRISFSKSRVFILDEYYPISPENELSFVGAIQRQFLNHLDIPQDNVFYLDCLTGDPEGECRRYEREIIYFNFLY
ncbi:MAG: glucosamine-6-phosphate deaminase [Thermoanaerobacteraceae bacterium]|nr:glucosamine-6-phosphate deaminase [Thermoanaerobacteraceae bacterium]